MLEMFESRMARNNKLMENGTFMEIMKENWLQVRHIVTVRMLLVIAYAALFTTTLAYVGIRGVNNLKADNIIMLLLPLLVISAVWLVITLKLNAEAGNYVCAIRKAFVDGKIALGDNDDWQSYMGMPLSPSGGILKWFTVGNLLVLFYSLVGMSSLVIIINAGV